MRMPHPILHQLNISPNGRFFMTSDGKPFFWLGDTGWLLFSKLTREEALKYLDDRQRKGFNVIQVMLLHSASVKNAYGDAALTGKDVSRPDTTAGNNFSDTTAYDYWDHVDYIIDAAAERGIYMALVPVWGSEVKAGNVSPQQATAYASFLAERYRSKDNIIWMNGGDIKGSDSTAVWNAIGTTLHEKDTAHLVTYHPRGRTQSSTWFHEADWLQFNCFQSGHRRYDQDTSAADLQYGEDNWKYVQADYAKQPARPTLDAEPSYENIPQGLHDSLQPYWKDQDLRRYAYWSVFAGGAGFTYGDNAVMQMHRPGDKDANYGVKNAWYDAINDPGSSQMVHIKTLMLSRPYFERVPDQSLIAGDAGAKYDHLVATRGKNYAFIYTYTGRNIPVNIEKIEGTDVKASWYDPRTGKYTAAEGSGDNRIKTFDPPGEVQNGNDWVLVLEWK
jgi:Protein of unknown function (DUF4038)/Putative collagen-binding domain of a collagenase